jgi:GTP-binding protein
MIKTPDLQASFVKSCKLPEDAPAGGFPEYAFIGRSNVGKSSLINMLVNRKKLAHISNTPGKTQLLNFFLVNNSWYLVDLPGYGYAKRSKKIRDSWDEMISGYMLKRKSLVHTFILVDSRLKPQPLDMVFMKNMALNALPFTVVFTKTDKLKPALLEHNISVYKQEMETEWEGLPHMILSSSKNKSGRSEILQIIYDNNALYKR